MSSERRGVIRILRELGLQLASRLRKLVGREISLDQQIVGAGKIWDRAGASFEALSRLSPIFLPQSGSSPSKKWAAGKSGVFWNWRCILCGQSQNALSSKSSSTS